MRAKAKQKRRNISKWQQDTRNQSILDHASHAPGMAPIPAPQPPLAVCVELRAQAQGSASGASSSPRARERRKAAQRKGTLRDAVTSAEYTYSNRLLEFSAAVYFVVMMQ